MLDDESGDGETTTLVVDVNEGGETNALVVHGSRGCQTTPLVGSSGGALVSANVECMTQVVNGWEWRC